MNGYRNWALKKSDFLSAKQLTAAVVTEHGNKKEKKEGIK